MSPWRDIQIYMVSGLDTKGKFLLAQVNKLEPEFFGPSLIAWFSFICKMAAILVWAWMWQMCAKPCVFISRLFYSLYAALFSTIELCIVNFYYDPVKFIVMLHKYSAAMIMVECRVNPIEYVLGLGLLYCVMVRLGIKQLKSPISFTCSGLLHWHWGNHMIAPVPVKQPWKMSFNLSHVSSKKSSKNNAITTTKRSTTKPGAFFMGYTLDQGTIWIWTNWGGTKWPPSCKSHF